MTKKSQKPEVDHNLQECNKQWWDQNPMSYDWHKTITLSEGTSEFFDQIDSRFFNSSPYFKGERLFERLIPFGRLRGKRVLEIGCGLGAHAQLISRAECSFTAIDLSPRAVELTKRRLSLKGIIPDVRTMDAEEMEFENEEFDFVWTWGVIHHSANPERIMREVHRVLKPSGEFRLMVYHRRSLVTCIAIIRGMLSGKLFRYRSISGILNFYSDGYIARFYTKAELAKLLIACGFVTKAIHVLGQTSELIPIRSKGVSGRVKSAILSRFPDSVAESVLSRCGSFLFGVAVKRPE